MKIKMLKTSASPSGNFSAGQIYTLPEQRAKSLIKSGAAVALESAVKPPELENATNKEAVHLGGGWYQLPDGSKVRKSELGGE